VCGDDGGVLVFGIFVLINYVMGVRPEMVAKMSGPDVKGAGQGMTWLGAGAGILIVFFVIGLIIGKLGTAKR